MARKFIFILFLLCASLSKVKAQTDTANTTIYTEVDKKPEFEGGPQKFNKFLGGTARYPAHARETNTQGKVEIAFVVEKDGALTNLHIVKGVAPDLDAETLRVFSLSPKWLPGIKNGKPARTFFKTPFSFTLASR